MLTDVLLPVDSCVVEENDGSEVKLPAVEDTVVDVELVWTVELILSVVCDAVKLNAMVDRTVVDESIVVLSGSCVVLLSVFVDDIICSVVDPIVVVAVLLG